jgi:hypothetical protein
MLFIASLIAASSAADLDLDSAVYAALSDRHEVSCEPIFDLGPRDEVLDALIRSADEVQQPAWAPVRAAGCAAALASESPAALDAARAWLSDPGSRGLAVAVLRNLDRLDPADARALAELGLAEVSDSERFSRVARATLAASAHPEVSALVLEPPAAE